MSTNPNLQKLYRTPSLTTDAIVIKQQKNDNDDDRDHLSSFAILLIKRKNEPFRGKFAFPGGFVDYGEDPEKAVLRELKEETNLTGEQTVHLIAVQGDPNRDQRKHVVTIAYAVPVKQSMLHELQFGDDAADAGFFPLDHVSSNEGGQYDLAFDHAVILKKYLQWFNEKGRSLLFPTSSTDDNN